MTLPITPFEALSKLTIPDFVFDVINDEIKLRLVDRISTLRQGDIVQKLQALNSSIVLNRALLEETMERYRHAGWVVVYYRNETAPASSTLLFKARRLSE